MIYAAVGCLGVSALSDLVKEVFYPFVQSPCWIHRTSAIDQIYNSLMGYLSKGNSVVNINYSWRETALYNLTLELVSFCRFLAICAI
jgi:hypothetical protein